MLLESTKLVGVQFLLDKAPVQSALIAQGVVQMVLMHQSLLHSLSAAHVEPSVLVPV